ncbi:hypothetical protein IWQ60_002732 [Tieghemiomyces parasiticus]|uniref:Uncharacterized protein n=1 Tax=Tieghemiomyces parasiticus TaxID=78921 RepID=A0A9W8AIL8_9FUNG|nr:hypothetical protein IWQ60_002732 [Tieghemiomyces parasiticus]
MPFFEDRPISDEPLTYGGLNQAPILTIKQREENSELHEIKLEIGKLLARQKATLSKDHSHSSASSKPFP